MRQRILFRPIALLVLFGLLSVVAWESVADGDLLPAPVRTLDLMDARPVSGQTGLFGSARLTRRELSRFKSEMTGLDVGFTKNADRYLNNLGRQTGKHIQAGFDGNTGTVFLRKGATNFEAFHEMSHARQWAQLGTEAYKGIGKYARETHVFNQIWKNRTQFSKPELSEAINYMRRLRQSHFDNLID